MKLEKTGKVIKVDPSHVIPMWKFSKDLMQWEPEEYLRYVGRENVSQGSVVNVFHDTRKIEPSFILFPVYRYSSILDDIMIRRLGIESEYEDRIKLENLSLFNVYKVIKDVDPEVDITVVAGITVGIVGDKDAKVRINDVGVDFKVGPYRNLVSTLFHWGHWYDMYLKTLMWAEGRKWSNFSDKPRYKSKVVDHMYSIEYAMFVFTNFLYTLYTGDGLKSNTAEYKLFKPYVDLLQSYGDTFEEAITTIKEMFVLIE